MNQLTNAGIKDLYADVIPNRYNNQYEFYRWFNSKITWSDYCMTYRTLSSIASKVQYQNFLELGPGPGTWTKVFYGFQPEARYTLIDISEEMYAQFKREMREKENVDYRVQDFMSFEPQHPVDFFLSSRAVEYLEDKPAGVQKICGSIQEGGTCVIVTKNCNFAKFLKRKPVLQHSDQFTLDMLKQLLEQGDMKQITVVPAIIRIPIVDRLTVKLSQYLHQKYMQKGNIPNWLVPFTESFVVTCTK